MKMSTKNDGSGMGEDYKISQRRYAQSPQWRCIGSLQKHSGMDSIVDNKSVSFIGSLMIILYYDPIMAIFALCSAPVTLLLSRTF